MTLICTTRRRPVSHAMSVYVCTTRSYPPCPTGPRSCPQSPDPVPPGPDPVPSSPDPVHRTPTVNRAPILSHRATYLSHRALTLSHRAPILLHRAQVLPLCTVQLHCAPSCTSTTTSLSNNAQFCSATILSHAVTLPCRKVHNITISRNVAIS